MCAGLETGWARLLAVGKLASMPREVSRWRKRATVRVWVKEVSELFTGWS